MELLGYSPQDFLLFSEETYRRLFAQVNAALWPLPVATTACLGALVAARLAGWRWAAPLAALALAGGWALVAEVFLGTYYAPVNWAVEEVLPAVWAQAVVLVFAVPWLVADTSGPRRVAGELLWAVALAYPLVGILAGRPLAEVEVLGLAPDPTAIATLALACTVRRAWTGWLIAVVPSLWLVASAATLITLGAASGWVVLAAAGTGIAGMLTGGWSGGRRTIPGRKSAEKWAP